MRELRDLNGGYVPAGLLGDTSVQRGFNGFPDPSHIAGLTLAVGDKWFQTAAAPITPPPSTEWVPLYGSSTQGNGVPTQIEGPAGRPIGIRRTYWEGNQVSSGVSTATTDIAAGRTPWLSFKLPHTWAQAKAGADDAWAADLSAQLGALPGRVLLTFHHEPEGDQTPITDFVLMHTRLYQFTRPYDNIRCGPILIGYDQIYGPTQAPATYGDYGLNKLWPGQFDSGDFIAFDAYLTYGTPKNGKYLEFGPTYLQPLADFANAKGVQWGIAEYGQSHDAADFDRLQHGGQLTWLRNAWNAANAIGGCIGLSYFDSQANSITDWRLETDPGSPSKLDVFVDILQHSPDSPPSTGWTN